MVEIKCGDLAKDKVTEIQGVVVVRHDYLHGVPRIGIQPKGSHDGKPHEVVHIDILQGELITSGVVSRDNTITKQIIPMGASCMDKISGFSGICSGRAEWLYSCTKVCISPRGLEPKTGQPITPVWFDEPQIELIEGDVFEPQSKDTGGFNKPVSDNSFNHSR